jgi:hydroxypyruvate isomerase
MISHPTAAELCEAIAVFEAEQVAPGDARQAFLARVADNARATVAREARHGARLEAEAVERLMGLLDETGDFAALNGSLCEALREGAIDPREPALLAHLRATAIGQIAIDQPTYGGLAALLQNG